jgi:predicted transcriptional regulator
MEDERIMMTIRQVMEIVDGKVLVGEDRLDTRVDTACGSDLMSDVLAFVKEKTVLITGLINPHVLRTAEMLDITCIVFSRGKLPSEEMLEMAEEIGITVISSPLTTYTACGELYIHGLPGTKRKTGVEGV